MPGCQRSRDIRLMRARPDQWACSLLVEIVACLHQDAVWGMDEVHLMNGGRKNNVKARLRREGLELSLRGC